MFKMEQRQKLLQLLEQSMREQARQVRCSTGRRVCATTHTEAQAQANKLHLFCDGAQMVTTCHR